MRAYKERLPEELVASPAYERGAAAAATAWLVWVLEKFLAWQVANDNYIQRQRLLDTIRSHADRLLELGQYPELQAWSDDLHSRLAKRWGIRARADLYPAFGGAPARHDLTHLRPIL